MSALRHMIDWAEGGEENPITISLLRKASVEDRNSATEAKPRKVEKTRNINLLYNI